MRFAKKTAKSVKKIYRCRNEPAGRVADWIASVRKFYKVPVKSDQAKKIVSVRVSHSDLEKVRLIAQRLRVRESKVLRFAIRCMLNQLGPLHDPDARGADLIPIFADAGDELARYFQFDQARLEAIINADLDDPAKRVDSDDIALISVNDLPASYRQMKLRELSRQSVSPDTLAESLRDYLYAKYVDDNAAVREPTP